MEIWEVRWNEVITTDWTMRKDQWPCKSIEINQTKAQSEKNKKSSIDLFIVGQHWYWTHMELESWDGRKIALEKNIWWKNGETFSKLKHIMKA